MANIFKKFVLSFVVLILALSPAYTVYAQTPAARNISVFRVDGNNATMARNHLGRESTPRAGQRLSEGNIVSTGRDTAVYLQLDEASILKMSESARVQVGSTRNLLSLTVQSGVALVDVTTQNPGQSLETRVGNIGLTVRGTLFFIGRRDTDTTTITMLSGSGVMVAMAGTGETIEIPLDSGLTMRVQNLFDGANLQEIVEQSITIHPFSINDLGLFELEEILTRQDYLIEIGTLTPDGIALAEELVEVRREERSRRLEARTREFVHERIVLPPPQNDRPSNTPRPDNGSGSYENQNGPADYVIIRGHRINIWVTELNLSNLGLTNSDIIPLSRLTNLRHLNLYGNNISDLSPIAGLGNLVSLELGSNQIGDDGLHVFSPMTSGFAQPIAGVVGAGQMGGAQPNWLFEPVDWMPMQDPTVTLFYDLQGGTAVGDAHDPVTLSPGDQITVAVAPIPPAGYMFSHWSHNAGGIGPTFYPGTMFEMLNASMTLFAIWIADPPDTFTLTFYGGLGAMFIPSPITGLSAGDIVTIPPDIPMLGPAMFWGWSLFPGSMFADIQPGDQFTMPGHNVTLYAAWEFMDPGDPGDPGGIPTPTPTPMPTPPPTPPPPQRGFPNLTTLGLANNNITNIWPLAYLPSLQFVNLAGNDIADWWPLSHLDNVQGRPLDWQFSGLAAVLELAFCEYCECECIDCYKLCTCFDDYPYLDAPYTKEEDELYEVEEEDDDNDDEPYDEDYGFGGDGGYYKKVEDDEDYNELEQDDEDEPYDEDHNQNGDEGYYKKEDDDEDVYETDPDDDDFTDPDDDLLETGDDIYTGGSDPDNSGSYSGYTPASDYSAGYASTNYSSGSSSDDPSTVSFPEDDFDMDT